MLKKKRIFFVNLGESKHIGSATSEVEKEEFGIKKKKYQDLADLLLHNERAKHFYQGLEDQTQIALSKNGAKICTMEDLRQFVDSVDRNKHK